MAEEKRKKSEQTLYGREDPTPQQMKAMGALEIPSGATAARDAMMRLTRDFQDVFYWTPKPQGWLERHFGGQLPHGRRRSDRLLVPCRPWDECGVVIHDALLWKEGLVVLRYEDKIELILCVEDLHQGLTFRGNEVRRKLVPVHPGEKDVAGILHKGSG